MCAPVTVTVSSGLSLTAILPQLVACIGLVFGSIYCFVTWKRRKEEK